VNSVVNGLFKLLLLILTGSDHIDSTVDFAGRIAHTMHIMHVMG
jgi:hypothetical protein